MRFDSQELLALLNKEKGLTSAEALAIVEFDETDEQLVESAKIARIDSVINKLGGRSVRLESDSSRRAFKTIGAMTELELEQEERKHVRGMRREIKTIRCVRKLLVFARRIMGAPQLRAFPVQDQRELEALEREAAQG